MKTPFYALPPSPLVLVLGLLLSSAALAQTFSVIHPLGDLSETTGFSPVAPLVQGPDGTLYGTTSEGEFNVGIGGTVFKIQPDGSGFTVLKHFTNYAEAWGPQAGLVLDGQTLYGTAEGNGGAVFKLNTDGSEFTVLKAFAGDDGPPISTPADTGAVLEALPQMPIQSWAYRNHPTARHLGPVAQDFHAAFGLGADDVSITTVDADGIALATIQGLHQKLTEELKWRDAENADLKARVEKLERLLDRQPTRGGAK